MSLEKKINPPQFKIGRTPIGGNHPCYIVAEVGINYDGERDKALQLIDVAVEAGVSAVKFQVFKSKLMYAENAGKLKIASGKKVKIQDLIKSMELPYEWLTQLKKYAESKKVEFFASVCDEQSADALLATKPAAFKIASYEITHLPLLEHVSNHKVPVIISCGGATMMEVDEAISTLQAAGQKNIVLMHCISEYDAPLTTLNLNVLKTLKLQYPELVIGYSDHSSDPVIAPVAAVALGAQMIEKHITLDRKSEGPDHSFALEPDELKKMVQAIRETEKKVTQGKTLALDQRVLGTTKRDTYPNEEYVRKFAYRLLYATKPIKKGDTLTPANIAVLRSGDNFKKYLNTGLHPRYYKPFIMSRKFRAKKPLKVGQAVTWDHLLTK